MSLQINLALSNRLGPSVRHLLQMYGLKAKSITPSGPYNILIKGDVLQYIIKNRLKPVSLSKSNKEINLLEKVSVKEKQTKLLQNSVVNFKDVELTNMKRTIAKRLTHSKNFIPHAYMTHQCNVNNLLKYISSFKSSNIELSLNDGIIKIAALALKQVPQLNAVCDNQSNIQVLPNIDISIAVATKTGLITPIIKNADTLTIPEISLKVLDLAKRARAGKLKLKEFQGGSFSISNLGMFGISHFSAVINPPQSAILAVGGLTTSLDDNNIIQQLISITLSYDSRVIDEETAAKYLESFRAICENSFLISSFNEQPSFRRLNDLTN